MWPKRTEHLLLSTAYLPPVEYVAQMAHSRTVYIEQWENYRKQTYRNRCLIAAAGGSMPLTLPVEKPEEGNCSIREVRLSNHGNWQHLHWNALISAYGNSPFFEYYADDFAPFYEKKQAFLLDYNEELLRLMCSLIGLEPEIQRTLQFTHEGNDLRTANRPEAASVPCTDLREAISPKHASHTGFAALPYYQVFAAQHGFQPNLSIADLLFNMGPESLLVLRDSLPIKQ